MKRIELVSSLASSATYFAEIGSDHGLISLRLLREDPDKRGLLIDNKKGPFEASRKAISSKSLEGRASALLSDGIRDIPPEVDTLVLAGMGGLLIAKILKEGKRKLTNIKRIVAEPQGHRPEMLKAIHELGYKETSYLTCQDQGHYYEGFLFLKGKIEGIGQLEEHFGALFELGGQIFVNREKKALGALKRLLEGNLSPKRREEVEREIALIQAALGRMGYAD